MPVSLNSQPSALNLSEVWDGDWAILEEYDQSGNRVQGYVEGYHGLVKTLADNVYYYQDELGSTSHIATASGTLIEWYQYDVYGKPRVYNASGVYQAGVTPVAQFLQGGARWMAELGLYDDRNRFMSPDLGRFIQPDPIGSKGDASNLYRYCGNDWANRTDPMGLQSADTPMGLHGTELQEHERANMTRDDRTKEKSDAAKVEKKDDRSFQEKLSAWEKEHQVSIDAHPGQSSSWKDVNAHRVLAAVKEGLEKLGDCKGDCGKNLRLGDEQYARVVDRDKIDLSKWTTTFSWHPFGLSAKESESIPDHPSFRVKLYDKEKLHDNPIAVTTRSYTPQHAGQSIRWLFNDTRVNGENAKSFLRQTHPDLNDALP